MILEFCDIENNVETINGIINYNIEDYISNIKINGFYGGFIELSALSNIYNKPIIFLRENYYDKNFYDHLIDFKYSDKEKYDLENIDFCFL